MPRRLLAFVPAAGLALLLVGVPLTETSRAALAAGALSRGHQVPVPAPPPGTIGAQTPGAPVPAAPGMPPARDRRLGENERGTSVIRGQVVAADTGAPLRRAQIRAFAQGGGGNGVTQSDAQGRFELTQLPAGRYFVSATRSGYVTLQFGQKAPNQPGTPVELRDGQTLDKVNLALPRGGAISGRIVDDLGEPIASVEVMVQRFAYMGGSRRLVPAGAQGGNDRTDDLGQFRLYGLPPGEYYVSATLRNMEFMGPNAMVVASGQSDGYAATFFPGTTSVGEARRVAVRAGQDVTNVSFALVSARLGRISGRVTTSGGEPYADGMLMVAPRSDETVGFGLAWTGAPIRGDGTFQTSGLPPGTYSLIVQPRGGPMASATGEVARMDVPINGEDVQDVFIVTGRPGVIKGRVVSDDGSALPFRPGQFRIFAQPRDPSRPMMGMRPSVVHDDWTFEVSGPTEGVRLSGNIDEPGGAWSMRHAWKDNVDLLDTVVDIAPGQTIEDVELVVTQKITELSGQVSDARNQPVTDASVVVFSEDKDRWFMGSRYVRVTRPDTNGKYTVRLTPAQNYRVVVVQGLEDGQFTDPEFLARALEYATAFDIGGGEAKVVNLKLVELR
jgi:hypothetical protein